MIDITGWIDRFDNLLEVLKENGLDNISARFTWRELVEMKMMLELLAEFRDAESEHCKKQFEKKNGGRR